MKRLITIILALTLLIAIAPGVQAYSVTVDRIAGYYYGTGGEFSIYPKDFNWVLDRYSSKTKIIKDDNIYFQSFCAEKFETITIPGKYIASMSYITIASDVDLTLGAAWLYNKFATGSLSGYDYVVGGRESSAGALQDAIWYFMDRVPELTSGQIFYDLAVADSYIEEEDLFDPSNGKFGVKVLNLFSVDKTTGKIVNRQDQLVLVPEPATLLLLGSGLLGLALYRRRNS